MTKTITPTVAADLYELLNEVGVVNEEIQDDTNTAHEWVVLGSTPSRTSRWHERYWMVLRNADDETYGIEYGLGLTEDQEHDLPWEDTDGPIRLTRLYPHEVVRVEYRTTPA